MSKRKGRPKGAPPYEFISPNLVLDARRVPITQLKRFHKWLGKYIEYWKETK